MSLQTLQNLIDSGVKLTPMMQQYFNIKKDYPDTLLLFRMGDFYEVFFDDAIEASKLLNISLTHRGKLGEYRIPMAGIPHHAASNYIDRITAKGLKAAICDQIENPKDAVGIVKRAVTQIVSPGIPYDLDKTESGEHNYICCASHQNEKFYLVTIDFTTGDFSGAVFSSDEELLGKLKILGPKELVTFMGQWEKYPKMKEYVTGQNTLVTYLSDEYFDAGYSKIYIEKLVACFERDQIIQQNKEILSPLGAIAYYLTSTQAGTSFCHLHPFRIIGDNNIMRISLSTLQGLEILPKSKEHYHESLLGHFDKTKTAMGSRLLKDVFARPLASIEEIKHRLDIIDGMIKQIDSIKDLRNILDQIRDLDRILAKVSNQKVTASDLLNIKTAVLRNEEIRPLIKTFKIPQTFTLSDEATTDLLSLASTIEKTINDEIGASLEKGNLIKIGANAERDRLALMHQNVEQQLEKFEQELKNKTNIGNLKVKFNNVNGFFIEISKSHTNKVPDSFIRRQTLTNAERYTNQELSEFEKEYLSSQDRLEKLERSIFKEILDLVAKHASQIQELSNLIAQLDLFQSLSWTTIQEGLTKPNLVSEKKIVSITNGWHPLIKSLIKDQFITHDITLDQNTPFGLITGPNMAGKTTVMREVAIIQFLAQIGSFIPAKSATLGICDYLFSRLGASDDIQKGQSTFMVEMSETSEILRHSTSKSMIILDEVGRGTSTYDGLSIAWSLVEFLVQKTKALTLFATHYHELIEVVEKLKGAKNFTVETTVTKGNVQFLYRLIEGGASQSYGIYVAKLAGLPFPILKRSEEILHKLENQNGDHSMQKSEAKSDQPSFLPSLETHNSLVSERLSRIENFIGKVNINELTPIDALLKLQELQKLLN